MNYRDPTKYQFPKDYIPIFGARRFDRRNNIQEIVNNREELLAKGRLVDKSNFLHIMSAGLISFSVSTGLYIGLELFVK